MAGVIKLFNWELADFHNLLDLLESEPCFSKTCAVFNTLKICSTEHEASLPGITVYINYVTKSLYQCELKIINY